MFLKEKDLNISNRSRLSSLFYILNYIPYKYKTKLFLSFILIIIAGIFEAELIRYLTKLLEIFSNINSSGDYNNFSSNTSIFIVFAFASTISRIFIFKINLNIGASISNFISTEIFKELTNREYEYSLNDNEEEDLDLITWQVTKTGGLIKTFLITASALFINFFIIYSILDIGIKNIFIAIVLLLTFYSLLAYFIKKRLRINSRLGIQANRFIVKSIQEVSCLRTEINLGLNSKPFIKNFKDVDKQGRFASANSQFLAIAPRYFIEGFIIIAGIIFISILYRRDNNINLIPLLGTIAFAIQRIFPNIQQIFVGWSNLNAQGDAVIEISKVLKKIKSNNKYKNTKNTPDNKEFNKKRAWNEITLKDISYSYKRENEPQQKVFSRLYLEIKRNDKLAFFGRSGSGKSTLIKIISGLLKPERGEILIDKKNIHSRGENMEFLQNLIAYVPQQTQILNKSIYDNLYLGAHEETKGDQHFLRKVINTCILEDFINSQPNGISTILGFRGKSVSGGQKQRLAIARAILERKEILILDEATSSLDKGMEKEIIQNILREFNDLTILFVTHNPDIMDKNCKLINVEVLINAI